MEFRLLRESDIEVRIGAYSKTGNGCSLLLYKNARVDMAMLDEAFGVFGWKRTHEIIDGQLFCTVSIYDSQHGQWVEKQDVGRESKTEAEKGRASDSFKRACFNIGIGRELYTAPSIWINETDARIKNGKTYDRFKVKKIAYEDRQITELVIVNVNTRKVVFTFGGTTKREAQECANLEQIKYLQTKYKGANLVKLLEVNGINTLDEMPKEVADKIIAKCKANDVKKLEAEAEMSKHEDAGDRV